MPHATLKMAPGVDKNKTPALNEAAMSDANLVRFMPDRGGLGLVQKIGGWKRFYQSQYQTTIRALWAWEDTNGQKHLGVGAETASAQITSGRSNGAQAIMNYDGKNIFSVGSRITVEGFIPDGYNGVWDVVRSSDGVVYYNCPETNEIIRCGRIFTGDSLSVITGQSRVNITPGVIRSQIGPSCSTKAGSAIVTIRDENAKVFASDTVFIKTQISVGGLILFGSYIISNVDGDTYDIVARNSIGSLTPAKETVDNGGVLPVFAFTETTPYVVVTLPNHGLKDGDTFTILDPVEAGKLRLYGNYIVSTTQVGDPVNQFQILITGTIGYTGTVAYPQSVSSDGTQVKVSLQFDLGLERPDRITWKGTDPDRNGTYTINRGGGTDFYIVDPRDWNNLNALGRIFKASGGNGNTYDICFSDPYAIQAGDTLTLSDYDPFEYNGTVEVVDAYDNRVTVRSKATGDILIPGRISIASTKMNSGLALYVYSRSASSQPVIQGYGVGGYGQGGYGIGGPAADSNTPIPLICDDWVLDNWGDYLIAAPIGGGIYQWNPVASASTAALIPNAPVANDGIFVAMPQRQIVAWGSTYNGIQDPLLIRWCDVASFDNWTSTVTNQAGDFRIAKGSKIVGCLQGPQQAIVWTDIGVWSMQYVGLPLVYAFNEIGTGCGLIGRKAVGSINGTIYWMGRSQFFSLGSNAAMPIPCPIWDAVFQDLDMDYVDRIRFAANSDFNEVAWYYPTIGSKGVITNYVKLNVVLNAWDYGRLGRTAWINQSVFGSPIGAGQDNFIYQHETSNDADGAAINSWFQTGYFQIGEGEYQVFVDQVWPDFKWGLFEQVQNADLKLTFYVANYPGDTPTVHGPFDMNAATQFLTPRLRGRLISIKVESNDINSFWRIGAMRYRFAPDGKF